MPTITSGLTPSTGGATFTSGGGGGGVFGPGATSGGGTTSGTISPFAPATSVSSSGSNVIIIPTSTGAVAVHGGTGETGASFLDDKRIAEIYYLGDKPWYDKSRYDAPLGFRSENVKTLLILATILLLANKL